MRARMISIKENSIASFNAAAKFPIDYRITELCLSEFLGYGPQREPEKKGRSLLRKTKDGKIVNWDVETDDSLCTLQKAFQKVEPSLGPIIFSSFQPDAALLVRKLQDTYPAFFLTEGGTEIYHDVRRNYNVVEAVYKQHLMGIDGVIVNLVKEITEGVSGMIKIPHLLLKKLQGESKPHFSQRELAFLLKLIPELIQQH
ncbi:hypothetical protein SLEP1_g35430 [Rubroshorea leprosula]|uniref:Glycerophosphodiester phosphodiesterase n=1 Tax=Rubroshorea leprosula TaxID=152421 RepID=A0AAV5KNI6_9ROSI|nr:hypothetical protein SLEP1_g35430 [Rubroshorea leprosula]